MLRDEDLQRHNKNRQRCFPNYILGDATCQPCPQRVPYGGGALPSQPARPTPPYRPPPVNSNPPAQPCRPPPIQSNLPAQPCRPPPVQSNPPAQPRRRSPEIPLQTMAPMIPSPRFPDPQPYGPSNQSYQGMDHNVYSQLGSFDPCTIRMAEPSETYDKPSVQIENDFRDISKLMPASRARLEQEAMEAAKKAVRATRYWAGFVSLDDEPDPLMELDHDERPVGPKLRTKSRACCPSRSPAVPNRAAPMPNRAAAGSGLCPQARKSGPGPYRCPSSANYRTSPDTSRRC